MELHTFFSFAETPLYVCIKTSLLCISPGNVEIVSSDVSKLSAEWPQFDKVDVRWTVDIVQDILNTDLASWSTDVTLNTLNTINNILFPCRLL